MRISILSLTTWATWTTCILSLAIGCSSNSLSSAESNASDAGGHDTSSHANDTEPTDTSSTSAPTTAADGGQSLASKTFDPPPARSGYTRFVAPVMENLAPGSDTMHCQYVQAPLDHDVDVLDVQGYQSIGGHHSVAYSTTMNVPVGTSRLCNAEDNMSAGFLGGTGGEGNGGVTLPPGVSFRLPKGSSIMLNTHFLNTTDAAIDGHSVVDFQFVATDPKRKVAALFTTGTLSFNVPPNASADAKAECTMPQDMQFILFTNHMHDNGMHAKTEVVRADGSVELVHEDPNWTYEMQFNADYTKWAIDKPLTIAKGEKLRTYCNWQNKSPSALGFPREMCFGVGFFLSDGSSAPVCLDGQWINR
jgi:hypothetical protein